MNMHIHCPVELKFVGADSAGSFEGYASVFGVTDGGGDMVAPGAFARSLAAIKAQGRQLPMYMMHGRRLGADPRPVGVWDSVQEDSKGLPVKGHLIGLDTETGRYNHALIKEGAMRGLSIGYMIPTGGTSYGGKTGEPRRTIKQANLVEISIVDDPMNAQAMMTSVKSSEQINTIREFEDFLRDVGGYSHAAAKAIAARGFKSSEPRDEDGAINDWLATLKSVRADLPQSSS